MVRVGVIGYGYWGPNLVRNFETCPDTEIICVADQRQERLDLVARQYRGIEVTTDAKELITNDGIDAVAIATPVNTHYSLALEAIEAGKHVFIEKPMTETAEQAQHLLDEASKRGLTVMVDHTFIYTDSVKKIREMVDNGDLGDIYYYDSMRVNLGLFQRDVSVVWDLAVHDFSILQHILNERPTKVAATGISHVPDSPENTAFITLFYPSGCIAHINVNWLAPVKVRQTLIGGSKKMVVYDDIEPSEKIKVYDKGVDLVTDEDQIYQLLVNYRAGDMYAPSLKNTEALGVEIAHFADCISNGTTPITGGQMGLEVVRLLEAATQSMQAQGAPVEIDPAS